MTFYGTDINDFELNNSNTEQYGGGGHDVLQRNDAGFTAYGGNGGDALHQSGNFRLTAFGGQGNDWLMSNSSSVAATLYGESGNDLLMGGGAGDLIDGGEGEDALTGGGGDDVIYGGDGNDGGVPLLVPAGSAFFAGYTASLPAEIFGGDGRDYLDGGRGSDHLDGGAGDDRVFGGDGSDLLSGGDGFDSLDGGDGQDSLDGGTAADLMSGGDGDDRYLVDNRSDRTREYQDAGHDEVIASIDWVLDANVEDLSLLQANGDVDGTGNNLDNRVLGNAFANVLDGRAGVDTLRGGTGNDTYVVDNTRDDIFEVADAGTDLVQASVSRTLGENFENLLLTGSAAINGFGNAAINFMAGNNARNVLAGRDGNDSLFGLGGDDVLVGGLGKDTLTGTGGKDRFDFNFVAETGRTTGTRDVITDFRHAFDRIDLSTIDANGAAAGNGRFHLINREGAGFDGDRGALRWDQQNFAGTTRDKTLLSGDINGDGRADFSIELTGLKTLTTVDFLL